MKRITINVTAQDIELGQTGDCEKCPIALAAKRVGLERPAVDSHLEYDLDTIGNLIGKSTLPPAAAVFVTKFDRGGLVEPFAFDIDVEDIEDASARRAEEWED